MNRVGFILKAKTQYNLHSPFVFNLYRKVLFARLGRRRRVLLGIENRFEETVYKMSNHLRPHALFVITHDDKIKRIVGHAAPETKLMAWGQQPITPNDILLVPFPHRNRAREEQWKQCCALAEATTTIDLYHTGIVLFDKKLSKQHLVLR